MRKFAGLNFISGKIPPFYCGKADPCRPQQCKNKADCQRAQAQYPLLVSSGRRKPTRRHRGRTKRCQVPLFLAAGLAIARLIITSIFRAIGSETHEGILA